MAETDRYVAFGSEYRALAGLPGIERRQGLGAGARDASISGNAALHADSRSGDHELAARTQRRRCTA